MKRPSLALAVVLASVLAFAGAVLRPAADPRHCDFAMAVVLVPEVGRKLRRARREKDLTQIEVANALAFHATLVSQIERGIIPQHLRTLQTLASFLGVEFPALRAVLNAELPRFRAAGHRIVADLEGDDESQVA